MERAARGWRRPGVLVAVPAALVAVIALVLWQARDGGPAPVTGAAVDRAVRTGIEEAQEAERNAPPDAAGAYRRIVPSLVTIVAGGSALGTGIVVNAQGAVLTALHVVEDGGRIQVTFADGTRSDAVVARRQPAQDIAVLRVENLPDLVVPAVLGGGAQVGDAVFPVGNPLGLQGSLSGGVVSALDRTVRPEGGRALKGLIQFDAAVNPGNSGGPLLDRDGTVVGIVTGLANPSSQSFFVGIGFAVPIATAADLAGGPSK